MNLTNGAAAAVPSRRVITIIMTTMPSLGPNTNVTPELLRPDCVLLVGEDAATTEPLLARTFGEADQAHSFRGYVFQRRQNVTTIFSGMGSGCVQALIWELAGADVHRLILVGTAGLMPGAQLEYARPYVISSARAAGSGMDAAGMTGRYAPRWTLPIHLPIASAVCTDFYYGFGQAVLDANHPLATTRLRELYLASREQLVDMEVAPFYAMCGLRMPAHVQYIAIKSPSNPAGDATDHLSNTPAGLAACVTLARQLFEATLKEMK